MLGITPNLLGAAATLYGVGAAASALLQTRQIVRRKRSCDVSARFLARPPVRGAHARDYARATGLAAAS